MVYDLFLALPRATLPAANDNVSGGLIAGELEDALRHFAAYGLAAARDAERAAKAALQRGDEAQFVYWSRICGLLSPQMGRALARKAGREG